MNIKKHISLIILFVAILVMGCQKQEVLTDAEVFMNSELSKSTDAILVIDVLKEKDGLRGDGKEESINDDDEQDDDDDEEYINDDDEQDDDDDEEFINDDDEQDDDDDEEFSPGKGELGKRSSLKKRVQK